jgi:solute:Na+ symporter, SSS family
MGVRLITAVATLAIVGGGRSQVPAASAAEEPRLVWSALSPLPDPVGVAGPFVGTHAGAVIVAGGANFAAADAADLWTAPKRWHAGIHVLTGVPPSAAPAAASESPGARAPPAWSSGHALERPVAYGASVTTPDGVACIGGDDGDRVFAEVFLLRWDPRRRAVERRPLPPLPAGRTSPAAARVGDRVYVVGGQAGLGLDSATADCWRLDRAAGGWEQLPAIPGGPRAFALAVVQTLDGEERLYVIGGRRQRDGVAGPAGIVPLADVQEFSPRRHAADPRAGWRGMRAAPVPLMAGAAAPLVAGRIAVLAADDGALIPRQAADPESLQKHPGFPRKAWAFDPAADAWSELGPTPANQVTTPAVEWQGGIVIASGETRPRVRTPAVWHVVERPTR